MKKYVKPTIVSQERLQVNEAIAGCPIRIIGYQNPYKENQSRTGYTYDYQAYTAWEQANIDPVIRVYAVGDPNGVHGSFTDWNTNYKCDNKVVNHSITIIYDPPKWYNDNHDTSLYPLRLQGPTYGGDEGWFNEQGTAEELAALFDNIPLNESSVTYS